MLVYLILVNDGLLVANDGVLIANDSLSWFVSVNVGST